MTRLNKPKITIDTIKAMEDMSFFTHALIFDDLLIVAQKETNCFVLKSTEGLIVIDAIWPREEAFNAIVLAIQEVGWNPEDIKKLVLTHGHVDHTGCGKWIVDAYHAKTYLSERDDIFWRDEPVKKNRPETWKDYSIDYYISDGDKVVLGDKTLFVYSTPGHTPGGLSFIFPVHEEGKEYMAALWGGSNPPIELNGIRQYLKSLDHFMKKAEEKNVQVALSNHTSLDCGLERIEYSRKRMSYMPNIYVIGEVGFRNYCQLFRNLCYDRLEEHI
ncbi:MBL fold metallo-hydrolase [Anaerosacchariphilus polymeriproducens]|uniref:MBL fold metallo-hydrolase n=1 Tax=Anaerosacchariphilus polymeriproducens TaxID=1812858 RepID=A0A371AYJ8_9FIRM|nr:MBL fold metallo-hydrolase [Anaerosacchariphilus polymeriproducens]RDU24631.1 MBL fold metallo-hydrolase [Anaerosacchariphilus polymeriproducens]